MTAIFTEQVSLLYRYISLAPACMQSLKQARSVSHIELYLVGLTTSKLSWQFWPLSKRRAKKTPNWRKRSHLIAPLFVNPLLSAPQKRNGFHTKLRDRSRFNKIEWWKLASPRFPQQKVFGECFTINCEVFTNIFYVLSLW